MSTDVERQTAVLLRDKYLLKGFGGKEVRWDNEVLCEVYRRLLLVYDDNYAAAGAGGGGAAAEGETTTKALARAYKYVKLSHQFVLLMFFFFFFLITAVCLFFGKCTALNGIEGILFYYHSSPFWILFKSLFNGMFTSNSMFLVYTITIHSVWLYGNIYRYLRLLGLSYLAPSVKSLTEKSKALRIISAIDDKICSRYSENQAARRARLVSNVWCSM